MTQLKIKERYGDREQSVQVVVDNILNDADYESGSIEILHSQVQNLIKVVSILCEALVISGTLNKGQLQSILGYRYKVE